MLVSVLRRMISYLYDKHVHASLVGATLMELLICINTFCSDFDTFATLDI